MPPRKKVETAFGAVDKTALETLHNSFDTRRLIDAIEAVDQIRSSIERAARRSARSPDLQQAVEPISEEE
jgi:hypothetical protein